MCSKIIFLFALVATIASAGDVRVVEGRVTDRQGGPVEDAEIEWGFFTADSDARERTRTDADGRYRLETTTVGPDYRLGVWARGSAPEWQEGVIPRLVGEAPLEIDFQLDDPVSLQGRVVDRAGQPIAGVVVLAQSVSKGFFSSFSSPTPSYPFPGPQHKAVSDENGRFEFDTLPPTTVDKNDRSKQGFQYQLSVGVPSGRMPVAVAYSEMENTIRIDRALVGPEEQANGVISGRVVDGETGVPIEEFQLVRRHRATMIPVRHSDGRFTVDGLAVDRRYQVFVYALGYAPFELREKAVSKKNKPPHECRLKQSATVQGIVVGPDGDPIANAEVVVGTDDVKATPSRFYWGSFDKLVDGHMGLTHVQRTTTDDSGRFEFCQGEREGVLAMIAPGYARRIVPFMERPKLRDDGVLRIPLTREATLSGRVLIDGRPEPSARLSLFLKGHPRVDFGEIKADAAGRFEVANLEAGTYLLSVSHFSGNVGTTRLQLRTTLGVGDHRELIIETPEGECALTGAATPFSLITAHRLDADSCDEQVCYETIGAITSPEGNYEVVGLEPGRYRVTATPASTRSGYFSRPVSEEIEVVGNASYNFPSSVLYR